MTLGELILELSKLNKNLILPIGFSNPHSYRGDYYDLGFEPVQNQRVGDALEAVTSAVDQTYEGWRGGQFTMNVATNCWFAEEGTSVDSESIGRRFLELIIKHARGPE